MKCIFCKTDHDWTIKEALQEQSRTADRLRQAIDGLSRDQLRARPEPDKWSIQEIIVHLRDVEMVYGVRYRMILSELNPQLTPFDQDRWAIQTRYQDQDLDRAVASFEAIRADNVRLLGSLDSPNLERSGTHPEYGDVRVLDMAIHLPAHDQNHLKQIDGRRKVVTST